MEPVGLDRAETILRFVLDEVNRDDFVDDDPVFVAAYIVPSVAAFRQFVMEVAQLGSMSAQDWLNDDERQRRGWPQAVVRAYNAYARKEKHDG